MRESIETLIDLMTRREFITGVAIGVIGLFTIAAVSTRTARNTAPWDLAMAISLLVSLLVAVGVGVGLVLGVAGLVVAGRFLTMQKSRSDGTSILAWVGLIAATTLIVTFADSPTHWTGWAVLPVSLLAGTLLAQWENVAHRELLGPLWAITAFAMWTTVPETEGARALVGVSVPLALATLSPIRARVSPIGSYAAATLFVWLGGTAGASRPASVLGAWASLGVIMWIPLIARYQDRHSLMTSRSWILVTHAIWALISARVFGLWESSLLALVALATLTAVVALFFGWRGSVQRG